MTIGRAIKFVAIVLGAAISVVTPVGGFHLGPHEAITRGALPANKTIEAWALDRVIDANKESDLHQTDDHRHFDNARDPGQICTLWNRGLNTYLDEAVKWAAPVGLEKRDLDSREAALVAFGRATHAIQDFYSHTNWIELQEALWNGGAASIPQAPILGQSCNLASVPGLHSGYFSVSSASQGLGCNASAQAAGWECHSTLNKDSDSEPRGSKQYGSGPGNHHGVAKAVAQAATASAWRALSDRIEARYSSDATDGRCVVAKLAWGGDRSCHRKWGATGDIKTHQEYAIPGGGGRLFHELTLDRLTISFHIDSVEYPGPAAPPVYADVRGTTRQRGTFCQWSVVGNFTSPKYCQPYTEDTIGSDDALVKVTPQSEPIELDWRVTFPGKKPDCGWPLIVRIDPGAPATQPFRDCKGGAPGLQPVRLIYSGSFKVLPE
jgi:hypothetical protein